MGAVAYNEILSKAKTSNDPTTNALVKRVGTRIAAPTGRTDLQWEFTVIDDVNTVNAFALPGGKIAVYTGIVPITRDEAGLAAVLGHEVAHVTARLSVQAARLAHQRAGDWNVCRSQSGAHQNRGRDPRELADAAVGPRTGIRGRSHRPDLHGEG
jgi:predicted Zn-dependent protease